MKILIITALLNVIDTLWRAALAMVIWRYALSELELPRLSFNQCFWLVFMAQTITQSTNTDSK